MDPQPLSPVEFTAAVSAITKDLNLRQVPAPGSAAWRTGGVRSIVRRPANIGMRLYRGEVVGPGTEQALVTEAEYAAALAVLNGPNRRTQRGTTPTHLLSGFAQCGVCGATLYATTSRGRPAYQCTGGFCVQRGRVEMDGYVSALVLARLADVQVPAREAPDEGLYALRARQQEIAQMVAHGLLPASAARSALEDLSRQIGAQEAVQTASVATNAVMRPLVEDPSAWETMPPTAKREVVRVLFESITLDKTGPGHRVPIEDVMRITWRSQIG